MKNWIVVAGLATFIVGTAEAQRADGPKALTLTAENLMAGDERHQQYLSEGGDSTAVFLGDVLHYRMVFTNISDVPVQSVNFTDPLPTGLHYVAGTAGADRDDVIVDFSIDGGATYWPQPMIEEVVDGQRVTKPAPPERYTHVRWRVDGWVQPNAQVVAEFRAMLPEAAATEPVR